MKVVYHESGHSPLQAPERFVYWSLWLPASIGLIFYSIPTSHHVKSQIHTGYLKKGYPVLSNLQDFSDYEWSSWKQLLPALLSSMAVYCSSGKIVGLHFPQYRQMYSVLSSMILFAYIISWHGFAVVLMFTMWFYSSLKFRSFIVVWLFGLAQILLVNYWPIWEVMLHYVTVQSERSDIVSYALLMCSLRFISFGCEYLTYTSEEATRDRTITFGLLDLLHYAFYLPLMFNGPLLLYSEFYQQFHCKHGGTSKLWFAIRDLGRCFLYGVTLEIFLHFSYTSAIIRHHVILSNLSGIAALSVMWTCINVYCLKYIIFYRIAAALCRFDGIVVPAPPSCVATMHSFGELWRTFDRGLHEFLLRYIYLPLGGSRNGFFNRMLGTCLCFTFVALWHGGTLSIWLWALANVFGVALDGATSILNKSFIYRSCVLHAGKLWYRRLCAALGSISVIMLIASNMIFIAGLKATCICIQRAYMYDGFLLLPLTFLFFYCDVHCCIDLRLKRGQYVAEGRSS